MSGLWGGKSEEQKEKDEEEIEEFRAKVNEEFEK
jgi:hypothetical protein